ncbi:MAG: TIGR03915 family putative DNA repair protein [Prolixibacteraceae bacterium]|nr:TIGR03915 family putative DNA repair protein [Prolixibacteraceae bacterium]
MIVYIYDKSFEGLLTTVFDAYGRKIFPDSILPEGAVHPMFTEQVFHVNTDEKKASRVWNMLTKKLSANVCNMLMYAWLADDERDEDSLFRYIRKAVDAPLSIENNFADKDILKVHQIAQKVAHESQYLKQFVRFQKAADDIFFAPVSPRYNALPLTITHFKDRFSDQKWVIYDLKRKFGFYYDLHSVVEITFGEDEHLLSGKLDEKLMAEDEKLFQDLWKGYFKALTIKERLNPSLQRQHMPRRFWKYLTEKQ